MFREIKSQSKRFYYLFKRHILNQLLSGDSKKILHYLKIIFKNKFLGYPRLAIIESGTTCNLNCATCPTPRQYIGRPPSLMNFENFKNIIDRIKDYVHVVLLYNTNEPLLNPALEKMIGYAVSCGLYTMISTNAALLDESKANFLLSSGLDEILLCLDGMSKEAYEPFRTGANFEMVKKNIENFCREKTRRGLVKPYVELQFIVTKLNQEQIPLAKQFAKEIGVDRIRIKSLALVEYAYSFEERNKLAEKYLPTRQGVKKRYDKSENAVIRKNQPKVCTVSKNQISILVNGDLALCCYDVRGEYIYGNLLNSSFKEIWFSPKNIKMRIEAQKRLYPLCAKCDIF